MSVSEGGPSRLLRSLFLRLVAAAAGFGSYLYAQPRIHVDLQDQVAPAMFSMAGVAGVLAGFAATAVVFIAGASGPGIDQMRLNYGRRLTNALLGAVFMLLISAVGLVICGVFANGWGAKGAACALLLVPVYDVALILLALRSAINSVAAPRRVGQDDGDV